MVFWGRASLIPFDTFEGVFWDKEEGLLLKKRKAGRVGGEKRKRRKDRFEKREFFLVFLFFWEEVDEVLI